MSLFTRAIVDEFNGPYTTLLLQRSEGVAVSKRDLLSARVNLIQSALKNRFIYEVRSGDNQLVATLIGTMHFVTEEVAKDAQLHDEIRKCRALFVEFTGVKDVSKASFSTESRYGKELETEVSGLNYNLDFGLMTTAFEAGLSIEGLDTEKEYDTALQGINDSFTAQVSVSLERYNLMQKYLVSNEEMHYVCHESYLNGNQKQLYADFECVHPNIQRITKNRNIKWLQKLVPLLKQSSNALPGPSTEKPICVAVGLFHLLGKSHESSLIPALRREGFTVVRKREF